MHHLHVPLPSLFIFPQNVAISREPKFFGSHGGGNRAGILARALNHELSYFRRIQVAEEVFYSDFHSMDEYG